MIPSAGAGSSPSPVLRRSSSWRYWRPGEFESWDLPTQGAAWTGEAGTLFTFFTAGEALGLALRDASLLDAPQGEERMFALGCSVASPCQS